MRKLLSIALMVLFLTAAAAEGTPFNLEAPGETIYPGKAALLTFTLPEEARVSIELRSVEGTLLSMVGEEIEGKPGVNYAWWNGTWNGVPAPAGEAMLWLTMDETAVSAPVTIGEAAPFITSVTVDNTLLMPDHPRMTVRYAVSGNLELALSLSRSADGPELPMLEWSDVPDEVEDEQEEKAWTPARVSTLTAAQEGLYWGETPLTGEIEDGTYVLTMTLLGDEVDSDPVRINFTVADFGMMPPEAFGELLNEETLMDDTEFPAEDMTEVTTENAAEDPAETEPDETPETDTAGPAIQEEVSLDDERTALHAIAWLDDNDQKQYTPSYGSPYEGQDVSLNYWTTPMDITDEETVWQMLMAPMTVLDTGKKNAQRTQITIRKEPDSNADGVGVVTCVSQGVHVLESRDDWTLIECYSSSFHDSKVKAWNKLVQGWVPTKYIRTKQPDAEMGIVVDKLTQRLYLFIDGHLYATLLVSTGLPNAKQPYNETRSGEFLICSAVGEFRSDNLYCSLALRYNSGDLLHEVPHTKNRDGTNNYTSAEAKLGSRASHGCIRTQRRTYPNGVNMLWLWNHRRMNTKIVIWEDWQGRQILPPAKETVLYYNPGEGKSYHTHETCYSAKGVTFQPFTYGELEDEEFRGLSRCLFCTPPLRLREIAEINDVYAPGGDHSPVMTEALSKLGLE